MLNKSSQPSSEIITELAEQVKALPGVAQLYAPRGIWGVLGKIGIKDDLIQISSDLVEVRIGVASGFTPKEVVAEVAHVLSEAAGTDREVKVIVADVQV